MFDSVVVQIILSLAFVYLLFSLFCTAISEMIASLLNLRGKELRRAIEKLVKTVCEERYVRQPDGTLAHIGKNQDANGIQRAFYSHPIIESISQKKMFGGIRLPSYISDRDFSTTLLDVLFDGPDLAGSTMQDLRTSCAKLPDGSAKRALADLLLQTDKGMTTVRENIEKWYNDGMDRVTGWYKRKQQWILALIAFVLAVTFNLDTPQMIQQLKNDDRLRQRMTLAASEAAKDSSIMAAEYDRLEASVHELPFSYKNGIEAEIPDFLSVIRKFLGFLLTTVALSLGAPFWFDVLNKVTNLRGAGKKPQESEPETPASKLRKLVESVKE